MEFNRQGPDFQDVSHALTDPWPEIVEVSFHIHFIASITYYNVNCLSPSTNLLIQKQVMRESIEKQKNA